MTPMTTTSTNALYVAGSILIIIAFLAFYLLR